VHHVGILYGQFMMHGQRNIKLLHRIQDWLKYSKKKRMLSLKTNIHFYHISPGSS